MKHHRHHQLKFRPNQQTKFNPDDMGAFYRQVQDALIGINRVALPGESVAETCLRCGVQHPMVRAYDAAVRQYRRSQPWNRGKGP